MPLPSPDYFALFPLQEVIFNKDDGELLSGGSITFYKDTNRTVKKPIYQQVQQPDNTYLFVELANPVTLSSIGSLANDSGADIMIYLWPFVGLPSNPDGVRGAVELYYIEVKSSGNILQFTREAWPPNAAGAGNTDNLNGTENQIANPQFVEVSFTPVLPDDDYTYLASGVDYEVAIAPDWSIVTTGSGEVAVKQIANASTGTLNSPPYIIDINSDASLSSIKLRQRITASPRLLNNKIVAGYFSAASVAGNVVHLTMNYVASGDGTFEIASGDTSASVNLLTAFRGTAQITNTSTDTAPDGYVDIEIILVPGQHLRVTSVQLIQVASLTSVPEFIQESTPRQIDHLFHYYKPQLEYKPIPSYLVGWDFPLNPAQEFGYTVPAANTGANGSRYVWDQTIAFQTVTSTLSFARNLSTFGLKIASSSATTFALVQYIPIQEVGQLMSSRNSIEIEAFLSTGTQPLVGTVGLYWTSDPSLPNIAANNSLVETVTAGASGGPPVTVAGSGGAHRLWHQVDRSGLQPSAPFTVTDTPTAFKFSGFDATATSAPTNALYVAIVISFNAMGSGRELTINYCSLVNGDIPTRPAPQTPDEVRRECEYYYEKSYDRGVAGGTITYAGALNFPQIYSPLTSAGIVPRIVKPTPFSLSYRTEKRTAPDPAPSSGNTTLTMYSTDIATANRVLAILYIGGTNAGAGASVNFNNNWAIVGSGGTKATLFQSVSFNDLYSSSVNPNDGIAAMIWLHYVADVRLGYA